MNVPTTASEDADNISDEDFSISDSSLERGFSGGLPSEVEELEEEPTAEEIEEWANVESPAIASVPSSASDKDANAKTLDPTASEVLVGAPSSLHADSAEPPELTTASTIPETESMERDAVRTTSVPSVAEPEFSTSDDEGVAGSGTAWGWGGGWGWQKLREAAVEAAKDVAELKESFQQVLAEVSTSDALDDVPPSETRSGDQTPHHVAYPAPKDVKTFKEEEEDVEGFPAEPRKQEVLQRLQGPDTQLEVGLKAIDDQMEQLASGAAKALNSLWGGLAGVAKGTLTAGHSLASKVENVTLELAKELVQSVEDGVKDASSGLKGVSQMGGNLASRAERGLETVGRTAMGLLEEAAGQHPAGGHRGGPAVVGEGASFDACFHSYGGHRAAEELEGLANECARLCNRTRAKLGAEQKSAVDDALVELSPLFDLAAPMPPHEEAKAPAAAAKPQAGGPGGSSSSGSSAVAGTDPEAAQESDAGDAEEGAGGESQLLAVEAEEEAEQDQEQQPLLQQQEQQRLADVQRGPRRQALEEQLRKEYQPIAELHHASLLKVQQLLERLREEAAAAAAASKAESGSSEATLEQHNHDAAAASAPLEQAGTSATAALPLTPAVGSSGAAEATASASLPGEQGASTAASGSSKLPEEGLGLQLVYRMQREAVQGLAELCATELQLLLRLGRSIVAPARYGRPADDGIQWPPAAVAKAVLLHRTARKMAADVEAAAEAFLPALASVEEVVAAQLLDQAAAQAAEAAGAELEVDCGSAAARVQEAFRNLLYVVLLSSLHAQGLLAP